jgi:hypothetical protein
MSNIDCSYLCVHPVTIVIFNRVNETRNLLIALTSVKPNIIYVISDGPRENVLSDYEKVNECRRLVDEFIDWECTLIKMYSTNNLGCMRRVVSGLDEVFKHSDKSIILEDDCIPSINFFKFCDWALIEFEFNTEIGMISGSNLLSDLMDLNCRNGFSKYISIWGWATWRRVWQKYDSHLTIMDVQKNSKMFFPTKFWENLFWKELFKLSIYSSKIWDFRLQYIFFSFKLFSVYPKYNLIDNIGFGFDATHTSIKEPDFVVNNRTNNEFDIYDFMPCIEIVESQNRDSIYLRRIWNFSILSAIKLKLGNLIRFSK